MKYTKRPIRKRQLAIVFVYTLSIFMFPVSVFISPLSAQTEVDCSEEAREARADFHSQNDIRYVDPCEDGCGPSSSGSGSIVSSGELPAETMTQLDNGGWKDKAEANRAAYENGEKESGIPWAVIATVHYREASMNPGQSIANGQPITGSVYTSIDGQPIGATLADDAVIAANKFKSIAKGVYDIELTADSPIEDWANAFLAYNRGYMYKEAGATFDQSPYVMNGYTENHMNMKWIHADSYFKGKKLNGLVGSTETRPGALAMLAYLGGPVGGLSGGDCGASSGIKAGDIVETAKGLAWDYPVPSQSRPWSSKARPEFVAALNEFNPEPVKWLGEAAYADCGIFVSTVMRASGVDPDFPPSGTVVMKPYLQNSPKYKINNNPTLENLQPGDILIVNNGSDHHIEIYTGNIGTDPATGQALMMIDASQETRVPSYRTQGSLVWMLGRPGVFAATFVGP